MFDELRSTFLRNMKKTLEQAFEIIFEVLLLFKCLFLLDPFDLYFGMMYVYI
jgi:hypothetical protein